MYGQLLHGDTRFARVLRRLRRSGQGRLPHFFPAGSLNFIPDGSLFFSQLCAAIAAARTFVCLEYYIIRADNAGQRLADLLIEACQRGVRIYLLYDYIGCIDTPETYFKRLRRNGIQCVAFNPPSFRRGIGWFDRRDHRKLTLIDGSSAFLGGCNIGDEYAGSHEHPPVFHDVGFSVSGPAIDRLAELFSELWQLEQQHPPDLSGSPKIAQQDAAQAEAAAIAIVSGGPHQRRSSIRAAFRVAMASTVQELLIVNPYFLPGPLILRSLFRVARRGVRVKLLLPHKSDVPLVQFLSRGAYGQLLRAGIEIYEMQDEILHAKLMLVDGRRTVIGSANLDQRSFHRNYELNAHIHCTSFGSQVQSHLEQDFSHARRIDLAGYGRRGFAARLLERVLRPLSWFL